MKKIIVSILSLILLFPLCSCAGNNAENTVAVYMPDGAPALVFAKMMAEKTKLSGLDITYAIVDGATPIKQKVLNGEADIAVMPTNLASVLYNGGEKIKLLSVNIHGSLYMVGKEQITGLSGLIGKTVYNLGQGQVPDITFRKILESDGIGYTENDNEAAGKVLLKYVASSAQLIPLMVSGEIEYGILGEPAVTQALGKVSGAVLSLDILDEWKIATGCDTYPQACIVAKTELIEKHPEFISALLRELEGNAEWLALDAEAAKTALAAHGSAMVVLNADVIERSNVYMQGAAESRNDIEAFFGIFKDNNGNYTAGVGGKLPDGDFYYNG